MVPFVGALLGGVGGLFKGAYGLLGGKGLATIGIAGIAYFAVTSYVRTNANTIKRLNGEITILNKNIAATQVDNETLKHNIKVVKGRMETLNADYEKVQSVLTNLIEKNQRMEKSFNRLHDKLYRESKGKMSLEELAVKKPGLVERFINKSIKDINKCVNVITGGEKNEKVDCSDFDI